MSDEFLDIDNPGYRKIIMQQHGDLNRTLAEVHSTMVAMNQSVAGLRSVIRQFILVIAALFICAGVSVMFWFGKIDQAVWLTIMLVCMTPWFGDAIKTVITARGLAGKASVAAIYVGLGALPFLLR